jgi:hypothetical protein
VWSYDEKSQTKVLNKVAKVFRNATTKMMRLVVGKDTILTTPEHPFYATDGFTNLTYSKGTYTAVSIKHPK